MPSVLFSTYILSTHGRHVMPFVFRQARAHTTYEAGFWWLHTQHSTEPSGPVSFALGAVNMGIGLNDGGGVPAGLVGLYDGEEGASESSSSEELFVRMPSSLSST